MSLISSKSAFAIDGIYISPHVTGAPDFDISEVTKGERVPFTGVLMDEKSFRVLADRSDQLDACEVRLKNYSCGDQWSFESVKTVEKVAWFGLGALLMGFFMSISK